ncbi:unnamed protein product [Leptosia nina]|uniref:Uncharacterized protein n=1 Tax=Leptosia nina TaxID=320188 RepID=A0AAV1J4C5_9NEOP
MSPPTEKTLLSRISARVLTWDISSNVSRNLTRLTQGYATSASARRAVQRSAGGGTAVDAITRTFGATAKVLDKRAPEQCKPYESSFSEGCPPADWCIGCTVCDCDANGRWDCHILSFCPDKKGKKQMQKKKSPYRTKSAIKGNNSILKTKKKLTTKKGQSKIPNHTLKNTKPSNNAKKNVPAQKPTFKRSPYIKKGNVKTIQTKKVTHIKNNNKKVQKKSAIKASNTKTIKMKSSSVQKDKKISYRSLLQNVKEKNDTYKLAEAIVKKVMANVEKFINENQKQLNNPKEIQKRSMPKNNTYSHKHKSGKNFKKKPLPKQQYVTRQKRSIEERYNLTNTEDTTTHVEMTSNKANLTVVLNDNYYDITPITKSAGYYKYAITSEPLRRNETKEKTRTKKNINNKKHKNILNALCKKFLLCHPDLSDKRLQNKLADLNFETSKILKTVTSIKGLLQLLNKTGNSSEYGDTISDIDRLDIILREYYTMDHTLNITETQRMQMKYVKENTQEFIRNLEKFALIFNDIIHIIGKQSKVSGFSHKVPHRKLRCSKRFADKGNQTIDDSITRLKRLLLSYNLVQNKFMSKMYDAIISLQRNMDRVTTKVSQNKTLLNTGNDIETYSRNIIENLRKLKELGQKLNSSGRVKRQAMRDEDAIEYLLVLMEYLLKQNKHVDNRPVSDGIDLLIDAIKNAPDIKPIKFNFVEFTTKPIPSRTTESSKDEILKRGQVMLSKEREYSYKNLNSFVDDFDIRNDNNKLNKKEVTPIYVQKFKEYANGSKSEEITEPSMPVYINKEDPETYLAGDKIEEKSFKQNYEVYNSDGDDENEAIDTIVNKGNATNEETTLKSNLDADKEHEKILNQLEIGVTENKGNGEEVLSKFDWGYDNRDLKSALDATTTTLSSLKSIKPQLVTRTVRQYIDKYANPLSGLSSEETDPNNVKTKATPKDSVKKIDIFSSFDYNADRREDSDSKEDKNDVFSDFV